MKKLNNKTRKISLRLSENTLNTLDEVVERMGFHSRSTLISLLMSQKKLRVEVINVCISDVIAKDLIREINRIGVNIKQISRRLREMKIEDEITFSFTKLDELKVYLEKKIGLISNLQSQKR